MAISRGEFQEAANKAVTKELRRGWWEVWPEYKIRERNGVRYLEAPEAKQEEIDLYDPLVSYPGLFLEFARKADDERLSREPEAVAKDWARDRGTLGLTTVEHDGSVGTSTRGGVEDSVDAFVGEAWAANSVLRLYEAATNPGGVDVETIRDLFRRYHREKYIDFFTDTPHRARNNALHRVADTVADRVAGNCYPTAYEQPDHTWKKGYDFANLLGAMWLQMLWLLTADDVRYCEYPECNGVVTYGQPAGGKKPRSDARFCSEKCRVYNHRLKKRIAAARRRA